MRFLGVLLGRFLLARKEEELGRPLTDGERNRIALLAALPFLLFALFCFYMAHRH